MRWTAPLALLLAFAPAAVAAELPSGVKTIRLVPAAGAPINLGTVSFAGEGPARTITVRFDESLFHDHFLSMRPFKCLEGPDKFYCHLPYPYDSEGVVTVGDLADLEYALLFVHKKPTEYGINLWNGVYYKLALEEGGRITGSLYEVDMDVLASPPPTGEMRPIKPGDLNPAALEKQWLPRVVIE
jgi:hypothetical protein